MDYDTSQQLLQLMTGVSWYILPADVLTLENFNPI